MKQTNSSPVYAVLGATGGIGAALSRRLADSGARLLYGARDAARLEALATETGAAYHQLDAVDPAQTDAFIERAIELYGRLDGAVNCVGSVLLKPAHLTTDAEWADTLALNLNTAFSLLRASARAMMKGGGSVVLMSSAAARTGLPNHEAIAAAKAGIIGLTQAAAASYASRGIRVNCVAPGLVRTPLTERITGNEASLKASVNMHALGRIGEPEDVASAIAWLLDQQQSWVTGQVFGIDGGLGTLRSR